MRTDYLRGEARRVPGDEQGKPHPMDDKCVNLIWVRMPNKEAFERLAGIGERPSTFNKPPIKLETFSRRHRPFLEPFKDIFCGHEVHPHAGDRASSCAW